MTEDVDDRMERAERIRQLRQRGGPSDAETQADAGSGTDAHSGTESDAGDHADTSPDRGAEEAPSAPAEADSGQPSTATEGGTVSSDGGDAMAATGSSSTTGLELPDQEEMQAALTEASETVAEAEPDDDTALGRSARGRASGSVSEPRTRVLEFELGDELFCIDIAGIEEIVKRETITRVPNTPAHVEGVVDLRGQITTILDAKGLLDIDEAGDEALIVVFAPDAYEEHGAVGWIVDEVRQVRPVTDEQLRSPPTDDEYVEGIVDREETDELVVWVRPETAMAAAFTDEAGD